jgi:DNA-binding transcriptional LysR family regulator
MDSEQLRTFDRIVREGSFSRAAMSLGLAQPTVSARVQALEQAVGGPLFERRGRSVALTDLGTSFLPFARRALDVLEAGVGAARQAQVGERGKVSIGVLESLSGSFLGPILAGFHDGRPGVDLLVRAGRQAELVELLLDGVIGLALLAEPLLEPLASEVEVLIGLREPVVLVASPSHPLARRSAVDQETVLELARPFLLLRWWVALPPALERLARRARPAIDVPMDTGRQMVSSGVGAGFFPWLQVADALDTGQLVAVEVTDLGPLDRSSVLVRRATGVGRSVASELLVEAIGERASALGVMDEPTR